MKTRKKNTNPQGSNTDTEYAKFLRKNPQFLNEQRSINDFTSMYPASGGDRSIYEEIFKKFNNRAGKIDEVSEVTPPDLGGYWVVSDMEKSKEPIERGMSISSTSIPEPKTMAHETVHAIDHQIDGMTPDIWKKLQELREKYTSDSDFTRALLNIQGKIQKNYFDADAYNPATSVKSDIVDQLNQFDQEIEKIKEKQYDPTTDWATLLPAMNKLVSYQPQYKSSGVRSSTHPSKNPYFKGQYASEFPAFALTNLTNSWGTDQGPQPLNTNEQEFLHDILGDMEAAYPASDSTGNPLYPTINDYIKQRRKSITDTGTWKGSSSVENQERPKRGRTGDQTLPLQKRFKRKAGGGYVSNNNSYDPYLNTYNYPEPLRLSEYLTDQMPESGYDETGNYDDPYMSYENAYDNDGAQYSFKEGGAVDVDRGELPRLADLIARYGRNGDTELAHINPIEAQILKSLGGSGTINPATGLREYGFFKNPFKAIKSVLGGGAGAIIGNMIAPGIGGIIGGALGQGVQHAARGKSALGGALKGAGMGAALPSMASGLGWGASKLGATALGSSLSNYGTTNAILPALGLGTSGGSSGLFGLGGSNPYVSGGLSAATALSSGMGGGVPPQYGQYPQMQYPGYPYVDNRGFLEKFGDNAKDYLTQPGNLLTLGTTAAQYLGREKPKSPEKIAEEERRYRNASRKTIAEVEADEALETARADLQKKRKNKQLDEDIKNMGRINRRVVSPEEFARTGRWLEYMDDEGNPVRMKGGGLMCSPYDYLVEEVRYPASPLHYLSGDSGGQDDLIDAKLSDGEYVIDAATVADLGDGNNAAGARKLDNFRRNIRDHKRGGKITLPPRAKSLQSYLMG